MKRLLLGVATMIGVQICFGLAGEIFAIESLPMLIGQVILAFFVASACGAVVSKRGFVTPSVAVWTLDFALCVSVIANIPHASYTYSSLLASIWPLMCGTLIAAVLGARIGYWFNSRRSVATATT